MRSPQWQLALETLIPSIFQYFWQTWLRHCNLGRAFTHLKNHALGLVHDLILRFFGGVLPAGADPSVCITARLGLNTVDAPTRCLHLSKSDQAVRYLNL